MLQCSILVLPSPGLRTKAALAAGALGLFVSSWNSLKNSEKLNVKGQLFKGAEAKYSFHSNFFLLRCICFVFKCFTPHKCTGRVLTILSMCFSFKYPLRRLTEILPLKLNFRYKDLARGLVRLIVKRKASYADPNGPPPTDSVEAFMQFRKVNMHSCDWEDGDTTIRTTYYNCILLHLWWW